MSCSCFLSLFFILCCSLILTSAAPPESEVEDETQFSYVEGSGKGPKRWGKINPHWQVCDNGDMQSPVDLLDKRVQNVAILGKLHRDYKPAPASLKNRGHDVEVIWKGDAGKIYINGTAYQLKQCHWHSPSEHTFNNSRYQMELHMVHNSSKGDIAVVGIVYKYGRPDPFLSKLLHHVKEATKEERDLGVVNPGDIKFGSRKYYRYIGSLTIPPCTQGVIWTIVNKVRTVSREQVHALRNVVHDGYEANARPTQALESRTVYMYHPRGSGSFV
ncbi:alpha carbonic anhydrase 4 [Euphorbia peplus]|nr:alpha carbonic anhydrase 4 [Euphorbia peplus]